MVFEKIKLSGGGSHRTIEHEIFFQISGWIFGQIPLNMKILFKYQGEFLVWLLEINIHTSEIRVPAIHLNSNVAKKIGVTAGAIGHHLSKYNLKRTPNMG